MRVLLLSLLAQIIVAVKFCTNKYIPSGSCPANAAEICAASGNYCVKSDPVSLQYSVAGVSGCEQFQTGGHSGDACFGIHVSDNPGGSSPNCYPVNRNYCECTQCTHNSNCSSFNGLPTGCEGEPAGSGDVYAAGFAAGKECGADIWVEALRSAYIDLGQC